MPAMTRGPLPARVYWVRRLMVIGTALLLVVAIGRLLGNGSDGSDDAAELSADSPSATPSVSDPSTPSQSTTKKAKKKTPKADPTPTLAAPTGECAQSDIAVTPTVTKAVGGRDVLVVLELRTIVSEACTWQVSPATLTVDITSGSDDIWSSRDCPRAVPTRDVVVRKAVTTKVGVTWRSAKRSGESCTKFTDWAMPGWYHVTAAALGGEPSDVQFELVRPTPATITKTVTPNATATGRPQTKPSNKPSGAVEPD